MRVRVCLITSTYWTGKGMGLLLGLTWLVDALRDNGE